MNPDMIKYAMVAALAGLAGCGDVNAAARAEENNGTKAKENLPLVNSKESVITNKDGSVTRTRTETKEVKDADGNVIGRETSTYSETTWGDEENAGDEKSAKDDKLAADDGKKTEAADADGRKGETEKPAAIDTGTFLGLAFGEPVEGADKAEDAAGEPALKVIPFKPAKPLAGFDDYFAYVTPKTHRLVKVCACAKKAIDEGEFGRHNYLVEALENRYRKWARLASFRLPLYVLDVAPERGVSVCLAGASEDYETVIAAWDNEAARLARREYRELRDAAYREAVERRNARVKEAESAF